MVTGNGKPISSVPWIPSAAESSQTKSPTDASLYRPASNADTFSSPDKRVTKELLIESGSKSLSVSGLPCPVGLIKYSSLGTSKKP